MAKAKPNPFLIGLDMWEQERGTTTPTPTMPTPAIKTTAKASSNQFMDALDAWESGKVAQVAQSRTIAPTLPAPTTAPPKSLLNRIIDTSGQALSGIASGMSLGLSDRIGDFFANRLGVEPIRPEGKVENVARSIGEFGGSLLPISGLYGAAGRIIPKATTTAGRLGQAALKGGLAGGAYGGLDAAIEGQPLPEIGKRAATDAALFATGDAALKGLGMAYGALRPTQGALRNLDLSPTVRPRSGVMLNETIMPARREVAATTLPKTDPAQAFRAKINREPVKRKPFSEAIKEFQTQFVDDLTPLFRAEKGIRGKIASAENSLYKQARLFRGVPNKANEIVRTRLAPVVNNIEAQGYNYKDLGDYALAVHARDVNAKGIQSGFTNDEIVSVIQKYGTPEMEAARQELVKLSTDLLNDLADSGVISKELVGALRQKHPNYIPLFRHFDDDKIEFASGFSKKLANVTSPIKKLEGSQRDVIEPMESMVKNIFQATQAADRNRVALQLAKLADEDTAGQFIRRLPPGQDRGRLNTVYARVNGEQVYFDVNPDLYKSIMALDKESSNLLIQLLQKPASILRAGATLTPEFSFRNPIRDIAQAYVTSKSGFNPVRDFPVALVQVVTKGKPITIMGKQYNTSELYNKFLMDNAGYGNIVSADRKVYQEAINQIRKQKVSDKFVNVASGKSLMGLLRSIADASETATKLGEYRAALRSGATRPEAAYRARDVMDFARAGASVREANKVIAFLNASIQGKSKILRSFRENPAGTTARALTAVTLPTIATYASQQFMSNDKQRAIIADAPTWLKDTFWLVPIPGTDQVARIPKPFDLAPFFANLPERLLNYLHANDPQAFDDFMKETLSTLSIPVMLTGLAPFVEGMANYSFFRQGPIIPEREQDLRYPDQYDINTTETAKFIAKGVDKVTGGEGAFRNFGSPRIIDNTIRGLTAGLGTYATGAIDTAAEASGVVDKAQKPAKKVNEQPLLKAFLVNDTGSGKAMNDLYDLREKLQKEKGSAKANKKLFKEAGKLRYVDNITSRIGNITKQMRQIENDPRLDSKTKRDKLDRLNKNRNDLAIQAMTRLQRP